MDYNFPPDILGAIIRLLAIGDYIRFGAVCLSWLKTQSENRLQAQVPWLMLPGHGHGNGHGYKFFSLAENKDYYIDIPEMGSGHRCIGSSEGWLVSVDHLCHLHMFDPFSGTHIRLPSITTLSDFARVYRDEAGKISHYYMDIWGEGDYDYRIDELHHCYFTKVLIVSSSSSSSSLTAVAICHLAGKLAFAGVGDKSWTTVGIPDGHFDDYYPFCDIIFYREQLYAVSELGGVLAYDLSDVSNPRVTLMLQPPPSSTTVYTVSCLKYLVESSDGNLLLVWRRQEYWAETRICLTSFVRVFMLMDPAGGGSNWAELKSLGEDALFLGLNHSLALSTKDFPQLRRNCIYFTDDRHATEDSYFNCDLGVYNMEDGTFETYYLGEYQICRPPIWFSPTRLGIDQHGAQT